MSVRAFRASSRCRTAIERLSAARLAFSSRAALALRALKERSAAFAPALLSRGVAASSEFEQRACERFGIAGIGPGGDDQLAKLKNAALLQLLDLVG